MSNQYPKEVRVAFEQLCEGVNDSLSLTNAIDVSPNLDASGQERTNDTLWKPIPYIMSSFDGADQSANFQDSNGLTVPCRVSTRKSVPFTMSDTNLRDQLQLTRIIEAAKHRLASDINRKIVDVISKQGTLVISQSGAASGYDDVALADTAMNIRGIDTTSRGLGLTSADYNAMAGNLAARQDLNPDITSKAYRRAYLGEVAGFDTLKMDYGISLTAAAAVTVTVNGASQFYTPSSTTTLGGEAINKDNRYQDITVAVTSGAIAEGDAFTFAAVDSVHQITKVDTGELQTYRVVAVNSPTSIKISPPIISNEGGSDIEKQYQNCSATPADGAAITFLNTTTRQVNPFWKRESIELTPGILMPEQAGIEALTYTTEQGIQIVMQRQQDISTSVAKYRLDVYFGVTNKNPEMNGIMIFNQ